MGYKCDMDCFACRFPDCMASPHYIMHMERKESGLREGKRLVRNNVRRGDVERGKKDLSYEDSH